MKGNHFFQFLRSHALIWLAIVPLLAILVQSTSAQNGPTNSASLTRIYDIQFTTDPSGDSPYDGQTVTVRGVVTAIVHDGFVLAEEEGPWKAVFVYNDSYGPEIGEWLQVSGEVKEYFGMTQIANVVNILVLGMKHPDHIKPWVVPVQYAWQEQYESVLITVKDVTVPALLGNGEWVVANSYGYMICDDYCDYTYFPKVGDMLDAVTGFVIYSYGNFKLEPRFTNDIEASLIPHYALKGTIVTMNDKRDIINNGYVEILGDRIIKVGQGNPNCDLVYDVEGYIFPGLIDAHNHALWNVLDVIPFGQKFNNRYEWRLTPIFQQFVQQYRAIIHYPSWYENELDIVKLSEMRALTAGTTTMSGLNEDYYLIPVMHQGIGINNAGRFPSHLYASTFPLTYGGWGARINEYWKRFAIHLCEGIDQSSLNEFYAMKGAGLLDERIAIVHGVALGPNEFADMAAAKAHLIWSPSSNDILYGATANVPAALNAGVNVALSVDWNPSSSFNMLDEMRYADNIDNTQWSNVLTAQHFAEFATRNASYALGMENRTGMIKKDLLADLMIIPMLSSNPYEDLLDAESKDVMLTVVSGRPMYGDPSLMNAFPFLDNKEDISISGVAKKIATRITSHTIIESDKAIDVIMHELGEGYNAAPYVCEFLHYDPSFVGVPKRMVERLETVPENMLLMQNFPNPFNPTTTIQYSVNQPGNVIIRLFDALGRTVSTLVSGEHQAGAYSLEFSGQDLSSGTYIYTMEANGQLMTKSMVLLK